MPRKAKPKAKMPPKELVELFSFYARKSKHKNRVPVSELPKMILSLGKSPTAAELRNIVARVEATSGKRATLDLAGFAEIMATSARRFRGLSNPKSEIMRAFRMYALIHSGGGETISKDDLRAVMSRGKDGLNASEMREMIAATPWNRRGRVQYRTFVEDVLLLK